jgi:hypothetical protein
MLSKSGKFNTPDHNNYFYVFIIFCFVRRARHVAYMGKGRNAYRVFVGKPEG